MSEGPITQNEITALTRRFEEMEQRLTGLSQTNSIQLAMTLGERHAAREGRINARIESLETSLKQHIDHRNAELVEALSKNVGKCPNAE
ncbi:hypothetical protein OG317_36950 [Streptomyces sp. NBC_01167]|uniref:hypothetical protein n=1 Tax=Streptomyces sp. NBC_01167 TaxID=2903756 RepID=UPI00386FA310|nr:hypothetical protein OG317_36950 [Streptomyces sp. NBC_01167]